MASTEPRISASPRTAAVGPLGSWRPGRWEAYLGVLVVVVGVVLRFVTTSPLWLDEALSANIASLPLGEIPQALRQDGHPPLYYLLLHGWMELVGTGDLAVRALSGLFGVALLPLVWVAGRRRGGTIGGGASLVLASATPFLVRYSTEARMYSMLAVLLLAAWLTADDLRRGPDRRRWIVLALLTGACLLTHYWAFYLGAAAVVLLVWRWWKDGARAEALRLGSALTAGVVLFVPWLPSFLHQRAHTGTPWGTATRPTRAVTDLANGLGGKDLLPEAVLFGFAVLGLAALGLVIASARPGRITLDLRTVGTVRAEVAMAALTVLIGLAVGAATDATFVARYAAGFVPLLVVAAGVTISMLPGRVLPGLVMGVVLVLAGTGLVFNVTGDRTQGDQIGSTIAAQGSSGDVVVFCPDQLGPSTLRALPPSFDAVSVPALTRPERIDWVDYAERNRSADPQQVADEVLERAADVTVWVVYGTSYRTYEGLCEGVLGALGDARGAPRVAVAADSEIFEPATLVRFDP